MTRRRWGRVALAVGAALVGIAVVSLFVDLWAVRSDMDSARHKLSAAIADPAALGTPGGRAGVTAKVDASRRAIADAHRRLTGSRLLSVARVVPGLKSQRAGALTLVDDAAVAASAARDLIDRGGAVADTARLSAGQVPLDPLARMAVVARDETARVRPLVRSSTGLWGPLASARRTFDDLAGSAITRLDRGADGLDAAATFLGGAGDRQYVVALQNNAEMRDQGSILSYAVVHAHQGAVRFDQGGSTQDLTLPAPPPTPVPAGTNQVFGAIHPTQLWPSVNASADFAWSGRAMADMYLQATGRHIDGIIAIDVPGLAGLLGVLGDVDVAGMGRVTQANVAQLVLHDQYDGLPNAGDPIWKQRMADDSTRREHQADLTQALIERLTSGDRDAVALGRTLGQAASGGHLRLWSSADGEERVFEQTGLGGGPATADADRTFHLALENRTATKLDYFVDPMVRQDVRLSPNGDARVRTTVIVGNEAPTGAAPSYQLGPDEFTRAPGDYTGWVLLWGPAGSRQAASVVESGLELSQAVMAVGAGQRLQTQFDTVIPHAVRDGKLTLRLVPQPRLRAMALDVRIVDAGGWQVSGRPLWQGPWDRVRNLSWGLSRP